MIRAFLAVELGAVLRNQIAEVQQDFRQRFSCELSSKVHISWIPPTSIHLTMKFLGDIDAQLVDPLRESLASAVQGCLSLQMPVERLGAFPNLQQPRVLWVGPSARWEISSEARQLASLHQAVEVCCQSLGFASEGRPWSPHVTVARIKDGARQVGEALAKSGVADRPLPLGTVAVDSVVLMKSDLLPTGAVYSKLWEVT